MKRILIFAALALAACSPPPQPAPTPAPLPTAPQAARLTITPHPLITAHPDRVADGVAVALRPALGGVTIRVRLADGSYSPGWGGAQGQTLPVQGTGVGPLSLGTVFEVLDGAAWVEFARYE